MREKDVEMIREMLSSGPWGYAHHKVLLDEQGRAVDYEFLDVNPSFEKLTGLRGSDILGKRVTEVLRGIEKGDFDWIGFYGTLALEGGNATFEQYSEPLGRWYQVQVFSSEKGYFTTLFVDITAEKQRAEELENFFNVNLDLLCIADTKGNFIKVNKAWEDVLGYDVAYLEERTFLEFVHPEDMEATLAAMAKLDAQEQVLHFVNRYHCKDGSYRFIEWRSHPKGKRIYAAARDITEQRRVLEELEAQREQFQLAIRGTHDGIWDWNLRTNELFLSERWKEMLGYRDEELLNQFDSFASLIYEEDREWVFAYVQRYLRGEVEKYVLEFRMVHKDGSLRWILARGEALRDEKGIPYRMAGSHSDITERKRMELQLSRERERLGNIIEGTRAGTWEWNVQTGEAFFNEKWAEMVGYTLEELKPLSIDTWTQFVHPEDLRKSSRLLEQHFRRETEYYECEVRMRHREGHWIWVLDRGRVSRWTEEGKPLLMFGTHQNISKRKENEERLASSERNFRTFFESMDDMIFIGNQEGEVFYANPGVTKKLGYSLKELYSLHVLDLHPQNKRAEAEEIFQDMFAGKRDCCPLPLQKKDGTLVPVETRVWFGEWDGREALFAISKDLSREHEALQKFNKLFENNPASMALSSIPDRRFVEVNRAFLEYLGYAKEEVLGKASTELGLFASSEKQRLLGEELLRRGYVRDAELQVRTKSGEIREGLFSGEILDSQGTSYLLTVMTDITERKRAERELELQSAMQEILMHTAKRYINMSLDEVEDTVEQSLGEISRFVKAHRAYVFDYHWEAGICSNSYEWCDEGITPQKEALQEVPLEVIPWWVEAHRRGETLYIPEVKALHEGDGVREILEPQEVQSLMTVPMMEAGACVGFVGFDSVTAPHVYTEREKTLLEIFAEIMVNLRTRRVLEGRLVEEKEKAQAASRAKSEFLANMSHEIRTPLNGVIGFTDLLRQTPLSPVQEQYVRNANASGHTLLGIINDILDFSKIEAGKLELEMVETDLPELLEQSMSIIKYGADQKGLEVLLDLDLAMPRYALVDPVRLKQVLANLLSNAVKFTERGEVALQVQYAPGEGGRGCFTFSVRDTGIGIAPEEQKKLFKAFSQADSSTTRKFGGTGLGLVISQKLVQRMGGELRLESVPRKGSLFSFSIETECREGERRSHESIPGITRILGVDDNATNLLILEKMLAHWKIAFTGVSNPLEAFRLLEDPSESFDVVIMDYHMPYMDGLEAIRIIRQDLGLTPEQQPIILLHSSMENQEILEKSRPLGVRFRLTKPVKSQELFVYLANMKEPASTLSEKLAEMSSSGEPLLSLQDDILPVILIAEDNPVNMLLVTTLIRRALPSARLVEAKNGREAVRIAFEEEHPAMMFMDVQMPEMDGNEATRNIRGREKGTGRHLPIIGLTAGALSTERETSLAAGMDDFLTKPIVLEKLQGILAKYLPKKEPSEISSPSQSSSSPCRFDAALLKEDLGDSGTLQLLVETTLQSFPQMLRQFREALQGKDASGAAQAIHALKGAASSMRFYVLEKMAEDMEREVCGGNFQDMEKWEEELEKEWKGLVLLLEEQRG